MDHNEVFEAIRLVFHSDIPDALLRDVIEKAIKNRRDEMESHRDEMESRQMPETAKGAGEKG
jgi:hypothetical protein